MEERSFAVGACPNCGHDWTAHSDYIATKQRVCVEALLNGYLLHIHYTDQDTLSHAQVYEGDFFVWQHTGARAIDLCKQYISRRIRSEKEAAEEREPTLDELLELKNKMAPPPIVTHCGSTSRCRRIFQEARLLDTLANKMVWTVGCDTKSDHDLAAMGTGVDKTALDILHLWKIHFSHEVLILDVTDEGEFYLGPSTRRERDYAEHLHKRIRYWSHEHGFERPAL